MDKVEMEIPAHCTVLVVGGGPGGSYTAAALAREKVDVVLLESDRFPRYHIGESMLPSFRHFLRYIDLDSTFLDHGFTQKNGAAFKVVQGKREGYTDFISAGGPNNFTWNVIRSEADYLMFQHARSGGAKVFDGVRVNDIDFDDKTSHPVRASYTQKATGTKGTINFRYLVDASGRAGLVNTKYMKNRTYNKALKNVAHWGYWRGTKPYQEGMERENSPFFEALKDESGWAWYIPLHDGTVSIGVVMDQELATSKRRAMFDTSCKEDHTLESFYRSSLRLAPNLMQLISGGELTSSVKLASDYSYSASTYSSPYVRVVGDAGCFIDPFFSSGVHIALTGALSTAVTICAALKGDCKEATAANWHSTKIQSVYQRFLMVVLSAYHQMRRQDNSIWSQLGEDNVDEAFERIRIIIQGTADIGASGVSQSHLKETLDFCAQAWNHAEPEEMAKFKQKLGSSSPSSVESNRFSREELKILHHLQARKAMCTESTLGLDCFHTDVIEGLKPVLDRGRLGLVRILPAEL
ncbi:tryptophan 2-halogenase [Aspergillus udagawae]|nr:tryptophan 2-halogenase [Aspergillus udagawae]